MRLLLLSITGMILWGCAGEPRVYPISDTRWPQTVVNAPKDQVRERFLGVLAAEGATIDRADGSMIEVRLPDAHATMTQLVLGCATCGAPFVKANVVFSEVAEGTQIVVQYWRMIPRPNGTQQQMDLPAEDYNGWQKTLWDVRDHYAEKPAAADQ